MRPILLLALFFLSVVLPLKASPADQLGPISGKKSFELGVGNQQFDPLAEGINKKQKRYQQKFERDYITPQPLVRVGFNNCLAGPPPKSLPQGFSAPAPLRQLGQLGSNGDVPIQVSIVACPNPRVGE